MTRERDAAAPGPETEPLTERGPPDPDAAASIPQAAWELLRAGTREHYEDAALYDYEYRRRRHDVAFYKHWTQATVPSPGPILDLACGSGRVALALARAGYRVVGVDRSVPMLARARARLARAGKAQRARVSLLAADMRRFSLGARFPLIVMAFNSFEHLYTRDEVAACLACVREHLEPGGRLIFDVQNPNLRWLCRDPDKRWARTRFTHPDDGQRYVYTTNHEYDETSQIVLIRLYYQPEAPAEGPEKVILLSQRKFFPAELEALLHYNGFTLRERYGDFEFEPLDNESQSQVLVCQER